MSGTTTTNVIGTECYNTSHPGLTSDLARWAKLPGVTAVDFTNVHIVAMRRCDPAFAGTLTRTDYFVPDSQVLYKTVKLRGGTMPHRVYGPDFLAHAVAHADGSLTHYFLGGSQDCLDKLLAWAKKTRPGIKIVGSHHGYFGDAENPAVLEDINRCSPDLIWVGLGTPKQQAWIHENRDAINRGVLLAVGFAFDVNAGTKRDAPPWMQKAALTWLYRLLSEPRRLLWRYVKYNSLFLWYLARQFLGFKKNSDSQ